MKPNFNIQETGDRPAPTPLGEDQAVLQDKVILVVDDEPLNLKMMQALLSREGCQVVTARNGKEALLLAEGRPDLILLDIMMPEQNGLETCRLLKERTHLQDIPVIFLSAFHDTDTKTAGLRLGGVDYITKPFQREELLARVRTHLTLKEQQERLRDYADHLEQMVEQRTRQLVHADRLSTLGTLVAAVAHEINNPLQALMGHTELILWDLRDMKEKLTVPLEEKAQGCFSSFCDKLEDSLKEIHEGCRRLQEHISRLKNFGKRDTERNSTFPLKHPIEEALSIMRARMKATVTLEMNVPDDIRAEGNPLQLSQVFINLIHNALDALEGGKGVLEISAAEHEGRIVVEFKDSGPGIPPDLWEKIFYPFFSTKTDRQGTGLGLFISRIIVEKHNGTLELVPHQGRGAWFRITLPHPGPGNG